MAYSHLKCDSLSSLPMINSGRFAAWLRRGAVSVAAGRRGRTKTSISREVGEASNFGLQREEEEERG